MIARFLLIFGMTVFALCLLTCCTVYRYSSRNEYLYVAPAVPEFDNEKSFNASFNKVWEGIISYFAERSITIETVEKDSGIIVAQKMFGKTNEIAGLIAPGIVKVKAFSVIETLVPSSDYGCLNPNYVRAYGTVKHTEEDLIGEYDDDAIYGVQVKFNIFAKIKSKDLTSVTVNTEFIPTNNVYGSVPQPRSTGQFESNFFEYLTNYLKT